MVSASICFDWRKVRVKDPSAISQTHLIEEIATHDSLLNTPPTELPHQIEEIVAMTSPPQTPDFLSKQMAPWL
jgi:hypothetical protein